MIAPYVQAAAEAPLGLRPNHVDAEVHYIAERDRCCLLSAELKIYCRDRRREPELAL